MAVLNPDMTKFEAYRTVLKEMIGEEYTDFDNLTKEEILSIELTVYGRRMVKQILGYSLG